MCDCDKAKVVIKHMDINDEMAKALEAALLRRKRATGMA